MVINPIVGVYIPIIRIPIKGGMTLLNIEIFDHGTFVEMPFSVVYVLCFAKDSIPQAAWKSNSVSKNYQDLFSRVQPIAPTKKNKSAQNLLTKQF